jgi:hypothetical protein
MDVRKNTDSVIVILVHILKTICNIFVCLMMAFYLKMQQQANFGIGFKEYLNPIYYDLMGRKYRDNPNVF